MARQILYIAKTYPGASPYVDSIANSLRTAEDLKKLIKGSSDGRGLLHWASWYDPWLLGIDLSPEHWGFGIEAVSLGVEVWDLSLTSDWAELESRVNSSTQYVEQKWLSWQLMQAYKAFEDKNNVARLFYGRQVLGSSLGDDELLAHK